MSGTDALLALLDALAEASIPYMVVGSYSSNFYGLPRSTRDADLVVRLSSKDWSQLPGILPEGLVIDEQSSFEMVTSTRREILRTVGSPFQIELFGLSDDPHDMLRFERRKSVEILPGRSVFLPTAEDVIIQKLRWAHMAGRSKDYSDTVAVMKIQGHGGLDWPYIESWCGQHDTLDLLARAKAEASAFWEEPLG